MCPKKLKPSMKRYLKAMMHASPVRATYMVRRWNKATPTRAREKRMNSTRMPSRAGAVWVSAPSASEGGRTIHARKRRPQARLQKHAKRLLKKEGTVIPMELNLVELE